MRIIENSKKSKKFNLKEFNNFENKTTEFFNIEEKSENEDDYEMNIPASFLLKKYDNNIKLLIEDFKKYS